MNRIPATVVTGFLGAGKTTLIRNLLESADGRRLALIVNEFGDVGVDGQILSDCDDAACAADDVLELANGCICCTVADEFIPTLEMLLSRIPAPDHIVIETSGLALPQPLVQAFNWPEVRSRVTVDGVITVVDTPAVAAGQFADDVAAIDKQRQFDDSLDHESPLHELFEDQLTCADLIVLNKTDLVSSDTLADVTRLVNREKREATRIVEAVSGRLPVQLLIGQSAAAECDIANRPTHHGENDHEPHHHDDFESTLLTVPDMRSVDAVRERVNAIMRYPGVLRAKGFVPIAGKPMRLAVQAVGPRVDTYFDRRWTKKDDRVGRLVVIGLSGLDHAALESLLEGSPK
ncbi:MAG: cobalamin biosynthesis protein CobW [Hyphomicrobiaceae bacterium]